MRRRHRLGNKKPRSRKRTPRNDRVSFAQEERMALTKIVSAFHQAATLLRRTDITQHPTLGKMKNYFLKKEEWKMEAKKAIERAQKQQKKLNHFRRIQGKKPLSLAELIRLLKE